MIKHYDPTKHHRGSSPPDQERGHESDEVANEWLRGVKPIPPATHQNRKDAKETGSSSKDGSQPEEESRWQDVGGESGG